MNWESATWLTVWNATIVHMEWERKCEIYVTESTLWRIQIQPRIRIYPKVRRQKILMVPFSLCHYGEQQKNAILGIGESFFIEKNLDRWKIPNSAVYGMDQRKRHSRYCVVCVMIIVITITRHYEKQSFTDSNIFFSILISFTSFYSLQPPNGKCLKISFTISFNFMKYR